MHPQPSNRVSAVRDTGSRRGSMTPSSTILSDHRYRPRLAATRDEPGCMPAPGTSRSNWFSNRRCHSSNANGRARIQPLGTWVVDALLVGQYANPESRFDPHEWLLRTALVVFPHDASNARESGARPAAAGQPARSAARSHGRLASTPVPADAGSPVHVGDRERRRTLNGRLPGPRFRARASRCHDTGREQQRT